ncbi:WD40 repeat domain-containing protein [Aspergillus tanneri]|uniref:Uncharacterized protein n=1 Tax=Aspergillus tanneri TaxID=1220188 RepID=A0A5M9N1B9_9EURO|nr:uncharacterized protein ATNIH1004_003438 [Aspergillus tanneri]KAA8650749.1 hypothetical protein ATNIH1004_003438 [Aspergillus tanneri]
MAYSSLSLKSKAAGPSSTLRITPSNSPNLKQSPRTPNKIPFYQCTLSLQTVIGTTTTTPSGFSSHDQSSSFSFCAGSAAVLAEVDEGGNVNQRFFKARPSASSINPVTSFYNQSAPPTTSDTRSKPLSSLKSTTHTNVSNCSPSSELAEINSPRSWSSRERVKTVTSVSISPNGRLLAVGEAGYNPRVLIFSTAKDAHSDIPLSILTEHTFGVRSLAFSSNSLNLASLGDMNDGFLFVWSVSPRNGSAKLHSTNKCTASVRDMCWMGQNLITAGVRHVKVWRLPDARPGSPSKSRLNVESTPNSPNVTPKALSGRNCLLGPLADNTFTTVACISDTEAVLGTDTGALCFLDDNGGNQRLSLIRYMGFPITSLVVDLDRSCIWIGGHGMQMRNLPMNMLKTSSLPSSPGLSEVSSVAEYKSKGPAIICMGFLTSSLVALDDTREIHIYPIEALGSDNKQAHMEVTLPGHKDAVLGVRPLKTPNEMSAYFFTWSCKGTVNFFDIHGKNLESRTVPLRTLGIEEEYSNELKVLRTTEDMEIFVAGDKLGVLRVLNGQTWKCVNEARAHGGEITDVALHSALGYFLVASCGRDLMGALTVVEEISEQIPKLLVGVSGSDKSVRIYDLERGVLLAAEFGHTEGISDVCVLENPSYFPGQPVIRTLVSSGIDGTVMIWDISMQPQQARERTRSISRDDDDTPSKEPMVSNPPLRKLLSRTEIAVFQRQENLPGTPTPMREHSPPLVRKLSKFSLATSPGKQGSSAPTTHFASSHRPCTSSTRSEKPQRSPSPPSPRSTSGKKTSNPNNTVRRPVLELRARPKNSNKSEFGGLNMSTEQLSRVAFVFKLIVWVHKCLKSVLNAGIQSSGHFATVFHTLYK